MIAYASSYTGALVGSGEGVLAAEALQLSETSFLKYFHLQIAKGAFGLDETGMPFATPRTAVLRSVASFLGSNNRLVADTIIRWKCISSEFRAILIRLGIGKRYVKTFQAIQAALLEGQYSQGSVMTIANQHKVEAQQFMKNKGRLVLSCLFHQSVREIESILQPGQLVLEYCPLQAGISDEHDRPNCVLVVLQAQSEVSIFAIDFKQVLLMVQKWVKALSDPKAQKEANSLGECVCKLLIPPPVEILLNTIPKKQVFLCPDVPLNLLPLELILFKDGRNLGEKCNITYLSSSRELLRNLVIKRVLLHGEDSSIPDGTDEKSEPLFIISIERDDPTNAHDSTGSHATDPADTTDPAITVAANTTDLSDTTDRAVVTVATNHSNTTDPANTTDHSDTTDPANTTDHSDTTDPANTTDHSGTTDPANTTDHSGTTDPANTTDHSGTTDPANATDHSDTTDPANATDHSGTTDPANTTDHSDTTDPANTTDHSDTTDPANTTDHSGTTDPADTTDLSGTTDPANTTDHSDTTDPANTTDHSNTTDPANTTDHSNTTDPANTTDHSNTTDPANTTDHSNTTDPANITVAADTTDSANATVPTDTINPAITTDLTDTTDRSSTSISISTNESTSPPASVNDRYCSSKASDCVIVAAPNFDLEKRATVDEQEHGLWGTVIQAFVSLFSNEPTESGVIAPLVGAEREATRVANILSKSAINLKIQQLQNDDATLLAVLSLQSPLILHFSTHGFCNQDLQGYRSSFWNDTKSGLLLAGANTFRQGKLEQVAIEAGTGELTAMAACGMSLEGTRLVYLSTCVSSFGMYSFNESLNSLAEAFRSAGAQTVIATLWQMSDDTAEHFSRYFYEALCATGTTPSQALALAKEKFRTNTSYKHWKYWSSLICIGEDNPVFPRV